MYQFWRFSAFSILISLLMGSTAFASDNLLVDGGFETDGMRPIGSPAAFRLWDSDQATLRIVARLPHQSLT